MTPFQRHSGSMLAVFTVLLLSACTKRTEAMVSVSDVTFQTLDGQKIVLSEVSGPVLVNFWSTNCVICLREMPAMAELHQDYQQRGFELIAVAMPFDPPNLVLEYAESRKLPFPVALDIEGKVLEAFEPVKGTPTSFLINTDGLIVNRIVGAINFDKLRRRLDTMLSTN